MTTLCLLVNYRRPDIDTYSGMIVQGLGIREVFYSGDILIDFAKAYSFAYSYPSCEEIIFHDSCELFVLDSKGQYAFNSDSFIVLDTHYA